MKRNTVLSVLLTLLLILPLFCFASCEPTFEPQGQRAQFLAKVTEVGDTRLFVTVIDKGSSGLQNGTPAYVSTNFEGYTAPAVGDYIIVEYDSMVQEIYPPIIPNVFSITKTDANGDPLK